MRLSIVAAIIGLAGSVAVRAQETVNLNLRCPAPCNFHQGESIWLDLDFTATTSNRYTVLTNYTDRPIASEEFNVTPQQGATDPVAPYRSWLLPAGSFHRVREPLSRKPVTVRMNLNQWIRFDQPGVYHVSVLSRRAGDPANPHVLTPVPAESNEVMIQIVPADPDWQKRKLAVLRKALAFSQGGEISNEVRELCDLGTEDAAVEMARQLGRSDRTFLFYELGLIRSPYPAAALHELQRVPRDPPDALARIESILAGRR